MGPVRQSPQWADYLVWMPLLTPDAVIVIYCDGSECELSGLLARRLREQGQTRVHVLFNGWTAWRAAGLPVTMGGRP